MGSAWLHVISTALFLFGVLDATQWIELNTYILGIYVGGNAISKFGEGVKQYAGGTQPYQVEGSNNDRS